MNKRSNKFSPEVRERAVRMVQEHRGEYPSLWAAIESIAPKIGCVPHTLNEWVRTHEVDTGTREGIGTDERERVPSAHGRFYGKTDQDPKSTIAAISCLDRGMSQLPPCTVTQRRLAHCRLAGTEILLWLSLKPSRLSSTCTRR